MMRRARLRYDGGITLYGGAGVQTRAGGDIQALTPGGAQVFGVEAWRRRPAPAS